MDIYTDGSCLGNPGRGGLAFLVVENDEIVHSYSENEIMTTNNRMELLAIIRALTYISDAYEDVIHATIYTDSTYVKNGITKWMKNWQKKGWIKADGKPVLNVDLWRQVVEFDISCVVFKWVKAHAGNKYNEIVDTIAREKALEF